MLVRAETPEDYAAIRDVNIAAFLDHEFSEQTEHLIVDALREAGALDVSLVAEVDGKVVGHVAFSAAGIGETTGWFLLGPVAVLPENQGQGIGRALIEAGLGELRSRHARGCVLVGDPAFYAHFGFSQHEGVTWPGVPDEYVLCLPMSDEPASGEVTFHPAFLIEA